MQLAVMDARPQPDAQPQLAGGLAPRAAVSAGGLAPQACAVSAGGLAQQACADVLPQADVGTRPMDEQFAARGLSPKLSPAGLPEFVAFSELLNAAFPAGQQPTESAIVGLVCAALLGRGIRGAEGVRWLRGVVGPSRWSELFGLSSLMRLGRELLSDYRANAQQKCWSWGLTRRGAMLVSQAAGFCARWQRTLREHLTRCAN